MRLDSYATSNTTFEEIFTKVRVGELEERDPDPLIGIRDLDILPDGDCSWSIVMLGDFVSSRQMARLIPSLEGSARAREFRQPNAAAVGLMAGYRHAGNATSNAFTLTAPLNESGLTRLARRRHGTAG